MKIAIVNHDFSLGGVQRVAIEVAGGLADIEGYDVYLISFSGNNSFFYKVSEKCTRKINITKRKLSENINFKLSIIRYKRSQKDLQISKIYGSQLRGLLSILEKGKFECVILCQSDLTALIPKIKTRLPIVKTIAWQHNDYKTYFTNYDYAKLFLPEYVLGLKMADHVVCLTESDEKLFKNHNPKTNFIYNPSTIAPNNVSKLNNNTVVFTGKLALKQKGLDYLLRLIELSPKTWKFKVAGVGPDSNVINKLVKDKKISSKIQFFGALKGDELLNHYLSGDVFVSTSRWEGFGLVVVEAMKCGLPIVAFNNSGPREILAEGKYGILVEKFNVEKMHEEVAKLMNNYKLRKAYQEKSLERVKEFTLSSIIEKWRKILPKKVSVGAR